jgi:hypothetical protein
MEVPIGALIPVDGKSIRASIEEYDSAYQDFVSLVSTFCTQPGVVIGLQSMQNESESEISTVQTLLSLLNLQGVCFSLDALHTQKTVEQMIESGKDYLISVKKNQPTLHQQLETEFAQRVPDRVRLLGYALLISLPRGCVCLFAAYIE